MSASTIAAISLGLRLYCFLFGSVVAALATLVVVGDRNRLAVAVVARSVFFMNVERDVVVVESSIPWKLSSWALRIAVVVVVFWVLSARVMGLLLTIDGGKVNALEREVSDAIRLRYLIHH